MDQNVQSELKGKSKQERKTKQNGRRKSDQEFRIENC